MFDKQLNPIFFNYFAKVRKLVETRNTTNHIIKHFFKFKIEEMFCNLNEIRIVATKMHLQCVQF